MIKKLLKARNLWLFSILNLELILDLDIFLKLDFDPSQKQHPEGHVMWVLPKKAENEHKARALSFAISQIEKDHGKGSIMKLGDRWNGPAILQYFLYNDFARG